MKKAVYRFWKSSSMSAVFLVFFLMFIITRAYCQSSSGAQSSIPVVSTSNSRGMKLFTLPPSVSVFARDTDAMAVLSRSVDAQGGNALWNSYQSVHMVGSLHAKSSSDERVPLSLDYDWTKGVLRSKADMTINGKRTVRISRPEDGMTEQSAGFTLSLSGRAHFSRFPPELPAVAASLALASPDEAISTLPISSTDLQAIRIVRFSHHVAMLETTQDWFFSLATGMPKYMIAYIPDPATKLLFRRHMYQYASFQTTNGLATPSEMAIQSESHTEFLTIDSSSFGASLSSDTFAVSAGGFQ